MRLIAAVFLLATAAAQAAPDEDTLGRAAGYPPAPRMAWAFREPYLVGSFSALDRIGPHCTLAASPSPLALKKAPQEVAFRYRFRGGDYSLDDYLQHQRATAVLVLKDGEVVAERYSYGRTPDMRMLSNSMAKTIVALAFGVARADGLIRSFDDKAATYAPELAGTLYGETRILNLLRMASGARFTEDYSDSDDRARFNRAVFARGVAKAAQEVTERAAPEGEVFNYASAQTQILGLVLRGATGRSLRSYVEQKLWQPMGAEAPATWMVNPLDRIEHASGHFNATVRDYARLGWLMANDGELNGKRIVPPEHLLAMTDPQAQPEAFRPGRMQNRGSTYLGYGLQTWLLPGTQRRFALLGIHGQAIYVDPALKLVVVHTAVGKDASGDASGHHLAAERDALLRGIVAHYGKW